VALHGASKRYGELVALPPTTLELPAGSTTVVMGPSGCGKTTLLRLLLGLEQPDEGEVCGLAGLRRAAVFQEDRLCEGADALANVCLPHAAHGAVERAQLRERAGQALEAMGLQGAAGRPVRELSGGMRRRVALARAVLADFDLIVFDEALKGLDAATKEQVMDYVVPHIAGATAVWVTHDPAELAWFADAQVVEL
jgi:NitT/TauT family transport system ATP-binding protein